MPDSALLSVLTGSGVAGVFCVLFICGLIFPKGVVDDLKEELREVRGERDAERDRADAAVAAAEATKSVMTAIRYGHELAGGHADHGGTVPP